MYLAIGGPKHGEWIPDMGSYIHVPIVPEISAYFTEEPTPLSVMNIDIGTYRLQKLGRGGLNKYKNIYLYEGIDFDDGVKMLKEYLLEQFFLMDDPDAN